MKRNITGKMICLLVLFVAAVLVGADLPASAQNTNSSMTGDTMMQNTNGGSMTRSRGRRRMRRQAPRSRRRARRNANMMDANANMMDANANMSDANANMDTTGNANMTTDTSMQDANANMAGDTQTNMNMGRRGRRGRRSRRAAAADANANMSADTTETQDMNMNMSGGGQGGSMPGMGTFGDVADLSGTYTGMVNYAEGGMSGDATLTITSNTFTITAGSATASGTLSARSWPGYTALSMRFGDTLPATIISTRAWHRGNSLRIQSVRGESRAFTFNGRGDAAGGGAGAMDAGGGTTTRARGRRGRGRRGRRSTPMMMTTPDAPPDLTPTPGQ